MATPIIFEVTRSSSRVANRLTLLLIAVPISAAFGFWFPFMVDSIWVYSVLRGIRRILHLDEFSGLPGGGLGSMVPLIVIAITILVIRSVRDKPSTIRLAEGGIRPSWGSRKRFIPKGRACFHPWVPAQMDSAQGACIELWCGRRSFIVGASGVSMIELVMDAPPKRAVDCEVSSSVFLKIAEGLFRARPNPVAATPHHDISLAVSSARSFPGVKDARLWLLATGVAITLLPITGINPFGGYAGLVVFLGGMAFVIKQGLTPKRLTHVLRISENGLQYRDPNGYLLADAPFSQVAATKLSYQPFKILSWVGERQYLAVLKLSFPDKTLFLSCPFGRESWNETTELCGPPQYDIAAYNWDELLSALSGQLQVVPRDT